MVTLDAGTTLQNEVEHGTNRQFWIKQSMLALGQLHHAGYAHGRPALRDIACQNTQLRFLDLEEYVENPTPIIMARDFLILLNELFRSDASTHETIDAAIALWRSNAPDSAWKRILRLHRQMRWIRHFAHFILRFKDNEESKRIIRTIQTLDRLTLENK